jgi:soluble lytic murein transglycosylase-like protein
MFSSHFTAAVALAAVTLAAGPVQAAKAPTRNAAIAGKVSQVENRTESALEFVLQEAKRKEAKTGRSASTGKSADRRARAKARPTEARSAETRPVEARKDAPKAERRVAALQEGRDAAPALRSVSAKPRETSAPAVGGSNLRALVARHAAEHGVPLGLAHGVVMVESRYNARATGPGGYIGLMQLSYRTAQGMGYRGSRAGLYDPETNLRYGMKYLGGALRLAGGSTCGAVSKYQGGHGVRGVTRAGSVYCSKVKRHIAQMGGEKTQTSALTASISPKS